MGMSHEMIYSRERGSLYVQADDARVRPVAVPHSSCEGGEQNSGPRCETVPGGTGRSGAGGAKGETKGNVGQQSTRRTRSRISVSQAVDRIRQVFAVMTRGVLRGRGLSQLELLPLFLARLWQSGC